ncbi:hypothetical protein HDV00_011703 [Rhizophlyctis rosea]|nr:hypothetical protein HDV00_011703 [Rhizophlyctis rosea]
MSHNKDLMYPAETKNMATVHTLTEWADEGKLKWLIKHPLVIADESLHKKLIKYLKNCRKAPNQFEVKYAYSKYAFINTGRLFAVGLTSLQGFPRNIRAFRSADFYIDVDQCNSFPTIPLHLMGEKGISCPQLEEYVKDRLTVLTREGLTKQSSLTILFTSYKTPDNMFMSFIHNTVYKLFLLTITNKDEFYKRMRVKHNAIKIDSVKENRDSSFLSKLCHTIENTILNHMRLFFEAQGLEVGVLVFDGMMISNQSK